MMHHRLKQSTFGCFFVLLSFITSAYGANDVGWPQYGLTAKEQRYSELKQIDTDTVSQLELAWSFDTDFNRGLEATPLVIDGVIYFTGNWSVVYALDAKSGKQLWKYDPQVPREWAKMACCDVVNRGAAVSGETLVFGTLDTRLIALNRHSGELLWETKTADTETWPYTITGAPRIAKGKVFIGNGGAEYGVRGFIGAYDLETGQQLWRFYTVPDNPANGFESKAMAMAAETWTGEWWKFGGGGTVWDSIVYDEELDQLYIGVGNGSPWNRKIRSPEGGDNLFLSSIVALNPDTGEYIWHYQETPAESWDYTATQHIMLSEMEWQGEHRKVIWHAPKNGFFFIIDRETGKLLSAEPYSRVNWASGYDLDTGRPIETEVATYQDESQMIRPSSVGAHNWHPMAHSKDTGYVYIPVIDGSVQYASNDKTEYEWGHWNTGVEQEQPGPSSSFFTQKLTEKVMGGYLVAWDPANQKPAWTHRHELSWNGGLLATAGNLVFQGTASGQLMAFAADSGEVVWQYDAQVGVIAPPVTYTIDGEQYISVLAGWGGAYGLIGGMARHHPVPPSRMLTFKIGGNHQLPPKQSSPGFPELPPRTDASEETIARGKHLYDNYCFMCHGTALNGNYAIPDLRTLPLVFYQNYDRIVRDGMMTKAGMVSFNDVLSKDDTDAIYSYIIDGAYQLREERGDSVFAAIKRWFYEYAAKLAAWLDSLS